MKKLAIIGVLAVSALAFTSCDNRPNVEGTWQGKIDCQIPGASTSSTNATYVFSQDGKVAASYTLDFTTPLPQIQDVVTPYEASVAASASIEGSWQYVKNEDDEIELSFDPSTLVVDIDPDALTMRANIITDEQSPKIDSLRPQIAARYQQDVATAIKANLSDLKLDDVKVKNNRLKFEIKDVDYEFTSMSE